MSKYLMMKDISKFFPGVRALDNVCLNVDKGEIHALIGENGAGKSTLMKILGGVYSSTSGQIFLDDKYLLNLTPKVSSAEGILFVHQELNVAEHLSVAENIYMGNLPYKSNFFGIVDYKKLYSDASKVLCKLDVDFNTTDKIFELSTAKKQLVEIAKAISRNAKVIIFDEPTTSLSDKDVARLFQIIRQLKEEGISIIYISHRLKEIFEICDSVTILRDGKYIDTCIVKNTTQNELIKMMVGRSLSQIFPKEETGIGSPYLEVKNLEDYDNKVKGISFHANRGEVLGFAGLVGAGRTEAVRLIFAADRCKHAEIKIDGDIKKIKFPHEAIKEKICLLTEDRKLQGLFLQLSVEENITVTSLKKILLNHKENIKATNKYITKLNIKTPSNDTKVLNLSGGNQQKIIISKWLNTDAQLFIFDEPTKGIDVGAKADIYKIINNLAKSGKTIIIISSELLEVMGVCDRIYVMCEGRITAELDKSEFSQERIMSYATLGGVHSNEK